MKTKLEIMVGYLAGRQGEDVESIRRELEDPSSEASRWLEAVRARSQGIFGPGSPGRLDVVATRPERLPQEPRLIVSPPRSDGATAPATRVSGRRLPRILWSASAAALVLLAVGAAWHAEDDRLRRLETILDRSEVGWRDRFKHLEEALTRHVAPLQKQATAPQEPRPAAARPPMFLEGPVRLALNRIEGKLAEFEQRLGESRASQPLDDQRVADLRRDLDQLKQDVQTSGRVLQEVLVLLRRLATNTQGHEPIQFPAQPQGMGRGFESGPGILLVPGQPPNGGRMPGPGHNHGPSSTVRPPGAR